MLPKNVCLLPIWTVSDFVISIFSVFGNSVPTDNSESNLVYLFSKESCACRNKCFACLLSRAQKVEFVNCLELNHVQQKTELLNDD